MNNKILRFRSRVDSFYHEITININQAYGIGFEENPIDCNTIFIDYLNDRYKLKDIVRLTNKQKDIFYNTYLFFLNSNEIMCFDINKTMEDVFKYA